jgi:3-dehydroquinate dehydratase type I
MAVCKVEGMRQEQRSSANNRVAASLALPDTESCLTMLRSLTAKIGIAEIRLDLMESFDLARLIRESPCPLIITCRPPREGGRFDGSEDARLAILRQAMQLECAYVDIEWDSVAKLREHPRNSTQLIVSRHWTDHMPTELLSVYDALKSDADVVKLVGMSRRLYDMFPVFDLLQRAAEPVIAIAMGEAGVLTRLLAPCFGSCLLTYGSPSPEAITAPGQLTVAEMVDAYKMHLVNPQTTISLHLCASKDAADIVAKHNSHAPGEILHVGLVVTAEEVPRLVAGMRLTIPHLNLTIDPSLASSLHESFGELEEAARTKRDCIQSD